MKDPLEQAEALDSYIDSLAKDLNAAPPLNLDKPNAGLVHALAVLEQGISAEPVEEVRERTWQKVLVSSQAGAELAAPDELLYLNQTARRKPRLAMAGLGLAAGLAIGVLALSVLLAVFSNSSDTDIIPKGYVTAIARATPNLTPLPSIAATTGRTTAFDGEVIQVAYSPDGKYLAVVTPQKLYLQDKAGQTFKTLSQPANNSHFVISNKDGQTPPSQLVSRPDNNSFVKIAWSLDSQSLAILSKDQTGNNNAVRLWQISQPTDRPFIDAPSPVTDIGWKADGQRLLTLSLDKGLRFWDLSGRMVINRITGDSLFALSPDGKNIAVTTTEGQLAYFDAVKLEAGIKMSEAIKVQMGFIQNPGPNNLITSLAWSQDSRFLATGYKGGLTLLWQDFSHITNTGDPVGNVTGLAWSPNGYYLAGGSDSSQLFLWHLDGPNIQAFAPLTRHVGKINSVAWSPDGKTLATGSDDHSVVEWTVPEKD